MATTPAEIEEVPAGSNTRRVALIVLGLVVLLALVYFLFLRSDPEPATAPQVPPAAAAPVPTPEPSETAAGKRNKPPIETFHVFAPKDPFQPAVDLTVVSGTGVGPGTVAAPAPVGTPVPGQAGGAPSQGGQESIGGHRVRLIDVFVAGGQRRARVQVDGTVYTVGEGERFATNFEVLSLSGSCASMLFGDDQFSLCEGEEILK